MSNVLIRFPLLNPVRMVRATNIADGYFTDEIPFFECQDKDYYQKWQTSDIMQFQVIFNPSMVNPAGFICQLRSADTDAVAGTFVAIGVAWQYSNYEYSVTYRLALTGIAAGDYYIYFYAPYTLNPTNYDLYYSEGITIAATHEGTILLKYTNDGNDFDMFFYQDFLGANPLYFYMRVEGGFRSDGFQPSSVDNMFADQTHNNTMLSSIPFNAERLTFGSNRGIPNWMADKINRVFSCTSVWVDGIGRAKNDGAKLEAAFRDRTPLNVWKLDVVKSNNEFVESHYLSIDREESTFGGAVIAPLIEGIMKPLAVNVPAISAGIPTTIDHGIGLPNIKADFYNITKKNTAMMAQSYKDPADPTNKWIVVSNVDIPAGTLVAYFVGSFDMGTAPYQLNPVYLNIEGVNYLQPGNTDEGGTDPTAIDLICNTNANTPTYQWQYRFATADAWADLASETAQSITFGSDSTYWGTKKYVMIRCVVTDSSGNIYYTTGITCYTFELDALEIH